MAVKFNPFTGNLDLIDTTAAAGSNTQIQFNSAGLLDGSADLTWDDTGKTLTVGGDIDLDDGGTYATTLQVITPTANRTISYPDATGTLALVAGSSGQLTYNSAGANAGTPTLTYDGSILTSSGRFINSYNATASSPAKAFTGTWFTGGTATTTKPQVLIEPTGTTSTAWSTSGTGLGINAASGFAGNLLDLQVGGASKFSISNTGAVTASTLELAMAGTNSPASFGFGTAATSVIAGFVGSNRVSFTSSIFGAGFILPSDAGPIGFSSAVATSPASVSSSKDTLLYRDAAGTLAQRNGTNAQTLRVYGTYTDLSNHVRGSLSATSTAVTLAAETAGTGADNIPLNLTAAGTGTVKVNSVAEVAVSSTVAGLPATPAVGMLTRVTDATAPAVGSTVAGGGAAAALVWWNGSNWTVIGV